LAKQKIFKKNYRLGNIFKRLKDASLITMYAIIYFNFSGSKEEWKEAKETLEDVAKNFDGMELLDILIPSSEWNYAALLKFRTFEIFTKYIKKTREEPITFFAKRGLHPPPKKLELLVDIGHLE
jgi:hypothetical protein